MKRIITICIASAIFTSMQAREISNFKVAPTNNNNSTTRRLLAFAGGCEPASQSADLDINNVRTKILNGGDMWWDLNNAKYEVPKVNDANAIKKNSLFAGALWIGGLEDGSNNLKLAAMTYRQGGSDFWPGPLDINNGTTEASRCLNYDKIWKIKREEIENAEASGWTDIPTSMSEWPGGVNRGFSGISSANETPLMAPFFDFNSNGVYEPNKGEYPVLFTDKPADKNTPSDQPDMMLWYVYNDNGNIHSETGGIPIGLELQMQAFAFATNDEVNNMTFYRSTIINRGQTNLKETYMGQWADPDLGNYIDDYVGCDVGRSLGICYNGDDNDEGVLGYGLNPPTIGIDYFEGPIDDNGDQLGLSHFMYFNNNFDNKSGNPQIAIHFYNYLQGKWRDGSALLWGASSTGVGGTIPTPWMWPFDTILPGQTLWTEKTSGNTPSDRRFVQSSGPFTLKPGAVNYITIGAVWAKATSGGALGSLELLRKASDKAQKLFNNKFDLVDGPDAPDVAIQELENELIMTFLNTDSKSVENYTETVKSESGADLEYKFQGYRVYQLKDATVNTGDLDNIEKAREIFQCDIKDEYAQIINKEFDAVVNAEIPVLKVDGKNEGVVNTLSIKTDEFSTASNKALVNFKTYYFLVLSYATIVNDPLKSDPTQYLAGRKNIVVQSAIPHKNDPELSGINLKSKYNSGPKITRIAGTGNGCNNLEFTKETIDKIMSTKSDTNPTYLGGNGPINIRIVDPVKVPKGCFTLEIIDSIANINSTSQDSIRSYSTFWKLTNKTTGDIIYSDKSLDKKYESVQGKDALLGKTKPAPNLFDWGMAITVNQVRNPSEDPADSKNGLIDWSVSFADQGKQWLSGLPDQDGNVQLNWIKSGTVQARAAADAWGDDFYDGTEPLDRTSVYEGIWDGRIAPFGLTSGRRFAQGSTGNVPFFYPGFDYAGKAAFNKKHMANLASVDLVITSDKSKWTRCIVLETGDDANKLQHEGGAAKFDIRKGTSKDKDGNPIAGETGRSWFPGYAINVETGERLNICFGEDSYLTGFNGRDMMWNPTSDFFTASNTYPVFGGKHYIYVMGAYDGISGFKGNIYDEGEQYKAILDANASNSVPASNVFRQIMWTIPAMATPGFDINSGIPTDVTIKLRTCKSYATKSDKRMPRFEFCTDDIAPETSTEIKKNVLELINVVPNPYYAYSEYETSPIDNRVKITNLPPKCTVSIFSMQGLLIKTFNKESEATYLDWDLKNNSRVPIATGVYLIHVNVPGQGEKTLKWYGVMRSLDLDSY